MGKIIKSKEVIAYKGMKSDMTCKGFQFEVGKSYKTYKVELCEIGFHACLNPIDVLDYYSQEYSRYFKVKLSGEITQCDFYDTKVAATEITILEEINIDEVIETTEWWKNDNVIDLLYFSDGFARVQRGDKLYNFIDKKGNILSDEWFYYVSNFHEDFAKVRRANSDWNFIDKNGKILSDEWFNEVYSFHTDFAKVQRGDELYNVIEKQGNILFNEWFNYVGSFQDGFARVQRANSDWNFIDKNGKILSDEWFNDAHSFIDGLAIVQRTNGDCCKIDKTGKLIKNLQ